MVADAVAGLYGQHLPHHAKGRLLDLGCGLVPLFLAYRDYISENICVDWGNSTPPSPYLDLEFDLNNPLPFENEEFDTIILSDVLEHIPEPQSLFAEMTRVLAPGGKLLLNVPFFYSLHQEPYDFYRYTHFCLERFVEKNQLRLILLEAIGGSPEVLADLLSKHTQQLGAPGQVLTATVQSLCLAFLKLKTGKKMSRLSSKKFPLGYFLIAEKP